ncbi:2-amino-4-hydroxy-6-hydroxymethyldihydropteridine diphosphokinase [Roseovarius rhodophyticola]|uniref:2-amino-4-hydroxy-6-hydroxymethyldihydropteridine pyrophosphokinase n=1 Tax=Roseovarius rhodophyticola TaxID=3080827 RepID=A0ABZ2TH84_9RHOB|nr:2-amino-4-hydroxy-6-hydroxymethyldihydropteridine diphosphokinase [Roseovarius sp. W115]MDV2929360.1 2-amino-4-hydroxy-6-hydroxymethyldihydropteridine diphosphokinase [Roseovarius sp. W115]
MSNQTCLIALGGNIPTAEGGPAHTLKEGLKSLARREIEVKDVSRFYATPCFPKGAGPDYVNAAALLMSDHTPEMLMQVLHEVEAEFGRARTQRWGQRTLDLDLLAVDAEVWPDEKTHAKWRALPMEEQMQNAPDTLILPHPRLQDRAFVLVPLADIAPDWRHPILDLSVREMLACLSQQDVAEVVPL